MAKATKKPTAKHISKVKANILKAVKAKKAVKDAKKTIKAAKTAVTVVRATSRKSGQDLRKTFAPIANQTSFEIETGIPVPARRRPTSSGSSLYPLASLEVGQSFFIAAQVDVSNYADATEGAKAQKEAIDTVINRMAGAIRRFLKSRNANEYNFIVRADVKDDVQGVRVFREELKSNTPE